MARAIFSFRVMLVCWVFKFFYVESGSASNEKFLDKNCGSLLILLAVRHFLISSFLYNFEKHSRFRMLSHVFFVLLKNFGFTSIDYIHCTLNACFSFLVLFLEELSSGSNIQVLTFI